MKKKPFQFIDHTADIAVIVYGNTLEELYEHSVKAFTSIVSELEDVAAKIKKEIRVEADDPEQLIVKLLTELIFIFDVDHFLCQNLKVTHLSPTQLEGILEGETYDDSKHKFKTEVKAVTYHKLKIEKLMNYYQTKIVFDL